LKIIVLNTFTISYNYIFIYLFDTINRSEEFQPRQARKREYEPILEENEENESPRRNDPNERDSRQVCFLNK
jgi:hypothetical protein